MSIKIGDIFQLGNHLLACGDSTDEKFVSNFLSDKKISCILTDPPYGVAYVENSFEESSHKKIINDHLQNEVEYVNFNKAWLDAASPYLSTKNSCYIFNSDKMLFALKQAMDKSKFKFSQLLIWIKNNAVIGRLDYLPQHELIIYGWHGTHQFHKAKDKSVIFCPKPNKSKLHPTMKSISLLRRLILNSTLISDWIYDPFGGSGSTLIACEQTKRKCLMIELDPHYCEIIINRFEKLTGIKSKQIKTKL
jgi:DNA modification methylase